MSLAVTCSCSLATTILDIQRSDPMLPKFNEKANSYAQAAVVQQCLATWLAQWLGPAGQVQVPSAEELVAVELGAGDGLFTQHLAPRFDLLTAIDLAPQMVQRGKDALPSVDWQVGDGWQPECARFDRLYSASFLQWCDEPVAVLKRWRELAKPAGRMLHGFYVAPTLAEWQSLSPTKSPVIWRSPEQWLEYFSEAGWSVLRSGTKTHQQEFASALDLVRFFHHTGATLPEQTSVGDLRNRINLYDQQFATGNGLASVISTWTFFRVEAVLA